MTVGVDSYITIAEADDILNERYPTGNDALSRWASMFDDEREAYLLAACEQLEDLPWTGFAAHRGQTLSFPRVQWGTGRLAALDAAVPPAIRQAQAELALWLCGGGAKESERRAALQAQGVTSFTLGDLSESYARRAAPDTAPLICPACATLIRRYLRGGYGTC